MADDYPIQTNHYTHTTYVNNATSLVNEKWNTVAGYITEEIQKVNDFIDDLKALAESWQDIPFDGHSLPDKDFSISDLRALLDELPEAPDLDQDLSDFLDMLPTDFKLFPDGLNETMTFRDIFYALENKMLSILNDNTGEVTLLGADVETQMFNREAERDIWATQDALDLAYSDWAERSIAMPGDDLFSTVTSIHLNAQTKALEKSRTIAEETRKVGMESRKIALERGNELTKMFWDYVGSFWQRALEAVKAEADVLLKRLEFHLRTITARFDLYKAQVEVIKAKGDLLVEIARGEIEVLKAEGDYAVKQAQVEIEILRAKLEQLKAKFGILSDAIKTAGSMAEGVATAALNSVSASAGISISANESFGYSAGISESHIHSYQDK